MRALARIEAVLLEQRGYLFPWAPVCLGLGIGLWFALRIEPGANAYVGLSVLGVGAIAASLRWRGGWSALTWAVALVALGAVLAGARAHGVGAPVLGWRYYGPIEGRVVKIDRSASDALRLTLDRVRLDRVAPDRTPARVRVSLHGGLPPDLLPGLRIMTTGHLSPPQGPAEPGGFDFRRHAWFQKLGAIGYTRNPVLTVEPPDTHGIALRILTWRMAASTRVRTVLRGDNGGFAAAVTTGDRSGVSQSALQALRDSNLAHLLAISGLHMGLLAGFVFAAIRIAIAAIPPLALRVPGHKIAAIGALIAAAGYLMLSGRNVATERAFVMVAVALIAVLSDRRVLSLRAVAAAALIVLVIRPEAVLSPGFQMSFAATTALVAVFTTLRDAPLPHAPGWLKPVLGVVISSAVAGAATAPVGAAHFNTMAHFGLAANLLCVPLMGLVVIPAAVLALLLAPLGLEALGLWVMGIALNWILGVAHFVANLPGAVGHVAGPGPWVLPLLALGSLWLVLWQGRARFIGLAPAALAFWLWSGVERPQVLVADSGTLVGVLTGQGRALSKPRGNGFVAGIWLENDGDGTVQEIAAARWPDTAGRARIFTLPEAEIIHLSGKRAVADFTGCTPDQIIIASVPLDLSGPCRQFDPKRLRATGSLAITNGKLITARDLSGTRLWH